MQQPQHGAIDGKTQTHMIDYYNLDVAISVGYRVKSFIFFKIVQNKLHYAITEKTAAELIYEIVEKIHMGLTTWKNYPI